MDAISTEAAAKILGVTTGWVRHLARDHVLQGVRWGRDWMIDPASVAAYAAAPHPTGNPRFAKAKVSTSKAAKA